MEFRFNNIYDSMKVYSAKPSPRPPKTSVLSAPVKRASAHLESLCIMKAVPSTESSPISCSKVVTSQWATAWEESQFTAPSSLTRTSRSNTTVLAFSPWYVGLATQLCLVVLSKHSRSFSFFVIVLNACCAGQRRP